MPEPVPPIAPVKIRSAGASHEGRGRTFNEDAFAVFDDKTTAIAIVADGTGATRSGRDAADLAVDTCARIYRGRGASVLDDLAETWWKGEHGAEQAGRTRARPYSALPIADRVQLRDRVRFLLEQRVPDTLGDVAVLEEETRSLLEIPRCALERTNAAIHRLAENDQRWRGHGAEAACAIFAAGRVSIAHVGCCRVSRIRRGAIEALTEEHTLAYEHRQGKLDMTPEQLAEVPANVVTRVLGLQDRVEPAAHVAPLERGDVFLLATDGLWQAFTPRELVAAVRAHGTGAAAHLVERGRKGHPGADGTDNLTLVVVEIV
jgi:serine/threonine protein phosphatase PrpC